MLWLAIAAIFILLALLICWRLLNTISGDS